MCVTIIAIAVRMQEYHAIEHGVREEAERREGEKSSRIVILSAELHRLWKEIKEGNGKYCAGREAEDEVQLIAQLERERAADERSSCGSERDGHDEYGVHK